ncbi:MAG TPA: radical SAM protein [Thermoanaerobaculia bacterium]|nr:radical SAM protein [Thermoanaerobaculia bacterium]
MRVLLVSGLGASFKNNEYLRHSLFDKNAVERLKRTYFDGFDLGQLCFDLRGTSYPMLRPRRDAVPHLTTFTLEAMLQKCDVEYDVLRTERIWAGGSISLPRHYGVILVSTTYVWDRRTLARLLDRLTDLCPDTRIVVGGQYSNLKYARILNEHPEVDIVVRGDGEHVLPLLLRALEKGLPLSDVPNLVLRDGDALRLTPHEMIDLETHPSPSFVGAFPVVPYESMRGCPFACKFCSFPMASPVWRYKSARKIRDDWARYAAENGARFIKAMDSIFTIPHERMRELLRLLPSVAVEWEGYSRANAIKEESFLEGLAAAHCRFLSIGFESMSPRTLAFMDKRVSVTENRHAFELLSDGPIGYRCSFMVGYPGETPNDYRLTHDFLTREYAGHFMLSVFSLQDEQMPVWADAERFEIIIHDPDDPDYSWEHTGMDVAMARSLNRNTLDVVRRSNDDAVLMLWQADYHHWLLPHLSAEANLAAEKAVERIAMLPVDHPDPAEGRAHFRRQLDILARYDVSVAEGAVLSAEPLLEA